MRSSLTSHKSKPKFRFNTLMLLLSTCITLCVLLSVHIHSQLHLHHHHHAVANNKNDNPRSIIEALTPRRNDESNNVISHNKKSNKNNNHGLSACLLVNDENPRLPEWIAYHYHMLPLRSLIVTVDPASRSSPAKILEQWHTLMGLDVQIWEDKDFLPQVDSKGPIRHGACDSTDPETDCLWHHRKRQRYFVKKCMADFKRRNMTWTLLTDVDEYITFNRIQEDDPGVPLDVAPHNIPTLSDWKKKEYNLIDPKTSQVVRDVNVEGTISGLPEEGFHGKKNGDHKTTGTLVTDNYDYFQGIHGVAYGNVVENEQGDKYFLRDDFAFRDAVPMANAPGGVPTLKDSYMNGTILHATIYNDRYYGKKDGELVEIETNWRESPTEMKTILGGHLMLSREGQTFYVEREQALWPPHLSSEELMTIRKRLPLVGDGKTILDVLESETTIFGEYAKETIGPCLSMPRLLYGSHENTSDSSWVDVAPDGFVNDDFVTLRYRWHAIKEAHANKFQKAIVDVSRLRMDTFGGEAENIHVPLKYYCRVLPPRYSVSFFRVNHYLDSFEAYSYRNDARSSKRQCKECYEQKGKEASVAMDDEIRPWLKSFVESVGPEKAKKLLAGAGNFVRLS